MDSRRDSHGRSSVLLRQGYHNHPAGAVSSGKGLRRTPVLLGPVLPGSGLLQTPVLLWPDPLGNGLMRTPVLLAPVPPGTGLLRTRLLLGLSPPRGGTTVEYKRSAGSGSHDSQSTVNAASDGASSSGNWAPTNQTQRVLLGLPPLERKLPQARSQVLLGRLLLGFRLPRMLMQVAGLPGTGCPAQLGLFCGTGATASQESCPSGPSRPGDQATAASLIGVGSSENCTATDMPVRLLVGTDWSGNPGEPAADWGMVTVDTDTTSAGLSMNRTEGNMVTADQPVN